MNKFIIVLILIVAAGSIWYWYDSRDVFVVDEPAMSDSPTPESVPVSLETPDGTYRLDVASSSMTWRGFKPLLNGYFDTGSIDVASGLIEVSGGTVVSGEVVIDMTTIAATKTGRGEGESMLSSHLQSDAFFDIEQYPTSVFRLTELRGRPDGTVQVSGELTIKATTEPISFIATVTAKDGRVTLVAEDVKVDRSLYDVRFGSGSFFDDLGDNLIDDIFTVSFSVTGVMTRSGTPSDDAMEGSMESSDAL